MKKNELAVAEPPKKNYRLAREQDADGFDTLGIVWDDEKVKECIADAKGVLVNVCKRLGVSRQPLVDHIKGNKELEDALNIARESMLDVGEDVLYNAVKAGEPWAVCFYLKCQGKSRGYVEKGDTNNAEGTNVQIQMIEVNMPVEVQEVIDAGTL
jgi:hypothetical protein